MFFKSLGQSIDNVTDKRRNAKIKETTSVTKALGTQAKQTGADVKVGATTIKSSISGLQRDADPRLERLHRALQKVELDPVRFAAEARVIKSEIRSVETQLARSNLKRGFGDLGLAIGDVGAALGSGGAGGGGGGSGVTARMGAFSGSVGLMGVAVLAAAPAVVSLAGAMSALVGSLGAAVGGAGALGVGVFGMAAVGIGSLVSVIKPAVKQIQEAKKAQDAYNKTVQQYGDRSKQALDAQRKMNQALGGSRGLKSVLAEMQGFSGRWKSLTGGARNTFFDLLGQGMRTIRGEMPTFARVATTSMNALQRALQPVFSMLRGQQFNAFLHSMSVTFSKSLTPFATGLVKVGIGFQRISQAASPYVIQMFKSFERFGAGFARSTRDGDKLGRTIGGLVSQTRSWWGLLKAAGRLMFDFFGAGARQGQTLVGSLTSQLNTWDAWVKRNPAKIQDFFRRSIDGATKLAGALASISKTLFQVADALQPVLGGFSSLVSGAGGIGALGPMLAFGGLKYLTRGKGAAGVAGAAGAGRAAGGAGMLAGARGLMAGGAGRIAMGLGSKVALPLAIATAGFGALTTQGTAGERAQGGLSALTAGLIPKPTTRAQARDQGTQTAMDFVARGGNVGAQVGHLQRLLGAHKTIGTFAASSAGVVKTGDQVVDTFTGKDRLRIQQQLSYLQGIKKVQDEEKKILEREKDNQRRAASTEHGKKTARSLTHLYSAQRKGGAAVGDAFQQTSQTFLTRMSGMRPAGAKVLAQDYVAWAQQLKKSNPQIAGQIDDLVKQVNHRLHGLAGDAGVVGGQVYRSLSNAYAKTSKAMGTETERWRQVNRTALTDIQKQMVSVLSAMGIANPAQVVKAADTVTTMSGGKVAGSAAIGAGQGIVASGQRGAAQAKSYKKQATGGPVMGPGSGTSDSVPTLLSSGEHVWTAKEVARAGGHHAIKQLRGAFGGGGQGHGGRYAKGGAVGLGGGIAGLISKLDGMGFRHGSTTGGKHAPNSYHYRGMAVDYGNASNDMARLWSTVYPMRKQFAELFGPATMKPGPTLMHYGQGFQDGALQAQHNDHIHMALAGGARLAGLGSGGYGAGGATSAPRIKVPRVGGRGAFGAAVGRSVDIAGMAAQQVVDKAAAQAGGGIGSLAGFTGGGSSAANMALGRKMMLAAGWGADQWPALKALWTRESGWSASAVNKSSGAYGIPQSLGHGHPFDLGDAPAQIRWGLNYIKGRYGSPGSAWAHEQKIGWYGNGADFIAKKPQVIGVGDRQSERVTVTPVGRTKGRRGSGGAKLVVEGDLIIHNNQPGDVRKELEKAFDDVAKKFDDDDPGSLTD